MQWKARAERLQQKTKPLGADRLKTSMLFSSKPDSILTPNSTARSLAPSDCKSSVQRLGDNTAKLAFFERHQFRWWQCRWRGKKPCWMMEGCRRLQANDTSLLQQDTKIKPNLTHLIVGFCSHQGFKRPDIQRSDCTPQHFSNYTQSGCVLGILTEWGEWDRSLAPSSSRHFKPFSAAMCHFFIITKSETLIICFIRGIKYFRMFF